MWYNSAENSFTSENCVVLINLRGIAWNHTRGYVSMCATAQRFEELNPGVSISWEKRSLQAFANAPISALAQEYDLVLMDHPHTALAATEELLLPYEDWLPEEFLADQAANSVGVSHASYRFAGRQWTLAIDAAAPISTWRPDLMEQYQLTHPKTWEEVLELARRGFVSVSAFPVDVLMHTYMISACLYPDLWTSTHEVAPNAVLAQALTELRRLVDFCDPECLVRNPIRTAEWMSQSSEPRAAYCPFAFGYSNYSRPNYAKHLLISGGLVTFNGKQLCSTLGGAGLSISARTEYPRACMDYAQFTASVDVQMGVYFQSGGQPGHRRAWTDNGINLSSSNFFLNTLPTLDAALMRPQFPGYMNFQDTATSVAYACIAGNTSPAEAACELNRLYRQSLTSISTTVAGLE